MAKFLLLRPAKDAVDVLKAKANELDDILRRCQSDGATRQNEIDLQRWCTSVTILLDCTLDDGRTTWEEFKNHAEASSFDPFGSSPDGSLVAKVQSYASDLSAFIEGLPHMPVAATAIDRRAENKTTESFSTSAIKIFISHSAKDRDFAAAVVDLLEATLNIPPDAIRCTSVDGYKLEAGDSPETLRLNIQSCDVLVALLTPASLESGFVLMELGAAWGFNKRICPVLAPRLTFNLLPGPSGPLHAVMADDRVGMSGVIDAVHKATQLSYRDNPRRERGMGGYMRQIPSLFPSSP